MKNLNFMGLFILFFSTNVLLSAEVKKYASTKKILENVVNGLNNNYLPIKVDNNLTFESAKARKNKLIYVYTISKNYPYKKLQPLNIDLMCNHERLSYILRIGSLLEYSYYDRDKKFIGKYVISKSDCKGKIAVPSKPKRDEYGFYPDGFDGTGYDKYGYHRSGFSRNGFNRENIHRVTQTVYNESGFNVQGYNKDGFNMIGFNKDGLSKDGYNQAGFDNHGVHKVTKIKFDQKGFDVEGYNKLGFNKLGFNKMGLNKDGYDIDGFKNGYNKNGYDKNGLDSNGEKRI